MNVGSKIKYYRNKKKLTQNKLGELSEMSGERVRSFENNNRKPKEDSLLKISNGLDCGVNELKSYGVSNLEELKACLLECVVMGGKEFCIDFVSSIDSKIISDMRKYFIRETKEVLLNVTSEEYENAMRK